MKKTKAEHCMSKVDYGCRDLDFKSGEYYCKPNAPKTCTMKESNYKRIQKALNDLSVYNSHNGRIDQNPVKSYFSRISHFLRRRK